MDANLTISAKVIVLLVVELLFSLALPIATMIVWKVKNSMKLRSTLLGFMAFFVFALIGQQALHMFVLDANPTVGAFIESRPWLHALYIGLTAGLFEETARLLMFRTALRDDPGRENAVAYGIGHGGFECIAVLGLEVIGHLAMAIMLNSGDFAEQIAVMSDVQRQEMMASVSLINGVSVSAVLLTVLERVCMFVLQLELSVFVFAAWHQKKMWLYPVAIAAHAGVQFISTLYKVGFTPLWLVEILLVLYVAALAVPACRLYKAMPSIRPVQVDRFGRPVAKQEGV